MLPKTAGCNYSANRLILTPFRYNEGTQARPILMRPARFLAKGRRCARTYRLLLPKLVQE